MPIKREEIIGDARLMLGDCLEIMPKLDKVDAVVTDPPYGIERKKSKLPNKSKGDYDTVLFVDNPEYINTVCVDAIAMARSVSLRTVLTPGQVNIHKYPEPDHMGVFWYPASPSISRWGMRLWQPIFYYGKDPYQGKLKPDSKQANDYDRETNHPCPKPIKSWSWLVNRVTMEGETILDPFMGSGTTGVACMNLGKRKFVGIELEPKYFDIACNRIEEAQKQLRLF